MAIIYPELENIERLKVAPTPGEWALVNYLKDHLDDTYEVFFNPFLDGDRPDVIILKQHCSAFIIEVKDWTLHNYRVSKDNKWEVYNGSSSSKISSPQSQAFRYKQNLYDLHLPVVGLKRLTNPNFYNLVQCFVYFHNSDSASIDALYHPAEEDQKKDKSEINQRFRSKKIDHPSYEKSCEYLKRKSRAIQRDKGMTFGTDRLDHLIKKIKKDSTHVLFDDDVYRDFKRRLSPSEHTLNQGISINFDSRQLSLTESKNSWEKIKGVAGCGKTSILSQRAINAHARHHSPVLILTFNITLKNYIRDKISDIQGSRDFSSFEISNYHQFYNSQANNIGKDIAELIDQYGIEKLYLKDIFHNAEVIKYRTILVDEIQDYCSGWVKIIRDNFLESDGEMVLFGDESQDIYQRIITRAAVIAQGFGRWIKLQRSYRTNFASPLNLLFKDFQEQFLIKKYSDTEIIETSSAQLGIGFNLLKYESIQVPDWKEVVFNSIQTYIKSYELNPNDVVVLSSKRSIVRQLNEFWIQTEKTHCMFESLEELATCLKVSIENLIKMDEQQIYNLSTTHKRDLKRVRRVKKNHFYANSGLIKLSTIHSYKGLESKAVFYVLSKRDEPEIVYTSITRAAEHLVVLDVGSNNMCSDFFAKHIK